MNGLGLDLDVAITPEELVENLPRTEGTVLLRSGSFDGPGARYSFVAARPFLAFRSKGTQCETISESHRHVSFGDPWKLLEQLVARYEMLEELDLPYPLGGCFGFWGYDLKNFVEPGLPRTAIDDLELPDCCAYFFSSLVVFDHRLNRTTVVSTGIDADGERCPERAARERDWWQSQLLKPPGRETPIGLPRPRVVSNVTRDTFLKNVRRAQALIRTGDIYQVNLSQRLHADVNIDGWEMFRLLSARSPAPHSAYLHCGNFELASSSPESFLRMSGSHVSTRPIKGTRPRSPDPTRDAQLSYELQTSTKEISELVMITDLLRNDLGKICDFGTVNVPELVRLERYAHVQHLVSTIEGRLRDGVTHLAALASCFPGGSITGAPKIRAMQIIDELESVTRGPYTGALGYLGFNRESQQSILIRTAVYREGRVYFQVGAGIVADSDAEAEYEETLAKARGFMEALGGEFMVS